MSRQTLITLQPAPVVDGHAPDGSEMTKLPYPIHAWATDGRVPNEFGGVQAHRIVGFMRDPETQHLDVPWTPEIADDPQPFVGLYMVVEYKDRHGVFSLTSPVDTIEVRDFERQDVVDAELSAPPDSTRRREGWA